jgi:hypothetical protein
VAELTDLVVDTVEPKVRANRRYRQKLEPCMRTTIAYLREWAACRWSRWCWRARDGAAILA